MMNISSNTVLGSYRKWTVGNDIRDILLTDTELSPLVGNRVYPIVAPENTEKSFIVYKREQYRKETVHQGVYSDSVLVSVTVVDQSYDTTVEIAEKIDLALYGQHTTEKGKIIRIAFEDSTEGYADNKYYQTLLYRVR